ncbi:PIG-L family deacetylase [Sanguibacter sp. HDW7]|uniref:PIG-L family deacetylase n=1 Tax=Sanguibacter sp. HDW7 TaxID=2714931 RepID=UPI001407AA51|nr:PIG-L family deacetylase [Sanguibacter sp. HDW7]QIK83853.1 bifunctional PIG-L family deacetylase/class I SAM-dependent methyltransferase [Sanguibacter sp. HDW7]
MVSFDAAEPGTDARAWDGALAALPALALPAVDRVVVLAAHADDETLGAGGLLARLGASGVMLEVVCVTDGAASHAGVERDELVATRRAELREALDVLCPGAQVHVRDHPDAATGAHRAAVRADLARVLDAGPDGARLLVVAPWHGDGHHDHRVVGEVAAELAAERGAHLWEYPVWLWHWGDPDAGLPDGARALTLRDAEVVAKVRALGTYESQTMPDATGAAPVLHARFLRHAVRDVETFVVTPVPGVAERPERLGAEYFTELYGRREDPWRLGTRWYERRKRALTVASLPREDLGRVLEIGCSLGHLTVDLASRAREVVALDVAERAVEQARQRVADAGLADRVDVRVGSALDALPDGPFDTVVVSEVGYYLSRTDLAGLATRLLGVLAPAGCVVTCHWRHDVPEYPLTGDDARDVLARGLGLPRLVEHVEEDFVLDVLARDPRSVAALEGLT